MAEQETKETESNGSGDPQAQLEKLYTRLEGLIARMDSESEGEGEVSYKKTRETIDKINALAAETGQDVEPLTFRLIYQMANESGGGAAPEDLEKAMEEYRIANEQFEIVNEKLLARVKSLEDLKVLMDDAAMRAYLDEAVKAGKVTKRGARALRRSIETLVGKAGEIKATLDGFDHILRQNPGASIYESILDQYLAKYGQHDFTRSPGLLGRMWRGVAVYALTGGATNIDPHDFKAWLNYMTGMRNALIHIRREIVNKLEHIYGTLEEANKNLNAFKAIVTNDTCLVPKEELDAALAAVQANFDTIEDLRSENEELRAKIDDVWEPLNIAKQELRRKPLDNDDAKILAFSLAEARRKIADLGAKLAIYENSDLDEALKKVVELEKEKEEYRQKYDDLQRVAGPVAEIISDLFSRSQSNKPLLFRFGMPFVLATVLDLGVVHLAGLTPMFFPLAVFGAIASNASYRTLKPRKSRSLRTGFDVAARGSIMGMAFGALGILGFHGSELLIDAAGQGAEYIWETISPPGND